ncbi:hypothetical protein CHLNCDRAFT_35448 [Chlorella variabilis]|uniref:Chromate transporter n=1 Tax=Chlorella variabilis TaxID=554065 RepID=E1ZER9_CHLVA|nr:hypothetical protein CHLNCDRAFT_35448 [Chlorella variabilis]EFN55707.1 hypothetical protein CHLNCDRAFT_35448 [Chlorella variabilis]|eukprot:XP_005847809.1 hypothetical protein CHLNCDRAFT_35448 [Chlorella variabilis]
MTAGQSPTGPPASRELDVEAQQAGAEPTVAGDQPTASGGSDAGGDRTRHDGLVHRHPTTSSQVALATDSNGVANGGSEDKPASEAASEESAVQPATYGEIAKHFGILGWTAFGGPAAHIAMFQKLFVDKLRWCTYMVFTELLMLGQCMPGPTSTQMGFAIGVLKKGLSGGLLSGVLFQGPGFLILAILGWAASKLFFLALDDSLNSPSLFSSPLPAGLAAAGVALVASAALGLVRNICKGRLLQVLCTVAAVIAYYYPKPWTFPSLIVAGGLITLVAMRKNEIKVGPGWTGPSPPPLRRWWPPPSLPSRPQSGEIAYESAKELHWFAVFYRTGSVIFGGGQVVLPMLYNDVVDQVWMSTEQFNAGLALAQAMPGPLFNFAAYLGAVIAQNAGVNAIVGVIVCWVGLFAPGIIIIFGILPFWGGFRKFQVYRRALPGLNSTAVGLIVASVFQLTFSAWESSPHPTTSICIGILAYGATEAIAVPAPLVVLGGGVIGIIAWAADMK